MKRLTSVWIIFAFLSFCSFPPAFARATISQARSPGESWNEAAGRIFLRLNTNAVSAYNSARPLSEVDWSGLPDWGNEQEVARIFQSIRDDRFLEMPGAAGFLRRLAWLYPDDGCYARAAMTGKRLSELGVSRPRKLFVFGNLAVDTPNSAAGRVYWWYHVVPAVKANGEVWVLDPSIQLSKPLRFHDWVAAMSVNVSEPGEGFTGILCSETTYEPDSPCDVVDADDEAQALDDEGQFLRLEWVRLLELGRSPERELGSSPPWNDDLKLFSDFLVK